MSRGLLSRVFGAIIAVALLSVGIAGFVVRLRSSAAFDRYLEGLPRPMGGAGLGRHLVLSGAEQTFITSVNTGILFGALIALALAALAALAIAYYLTRPLERLTTAAQTLAAGDLTHRVAVSGPAEVERLGEAFNEMAESLDKAEGLRRRLVADVAHEIRNPVTALRAQAEGIADGLLAPDPARLGLLAEDAKYLARVVEDLQELAAADAGQLSYEMETMDLAVLACRETELAATRSREGVTLECRATEPLLVEGDEGRLRQVVRNLLDNATRHTPAGSITVACLLDGVRARVEVRDTGEGIPEADLPFVFERFYRADAARARHSGGSGVGLAVSKRIVEDHGGTVFVSNRVPRGAIVGFDLPLAVDGDVTV
jgi:two-component system, OmpR family, sensor histidine kinase BaeS